MLRPTCHFTCPQTHLSWILLLNQSWTLPPRVEDPLKHGLTISSTLFWVTFQYFAFGTGVTPMSPETLLPIASPFQVPSAPLFLSVLSPSFQPQLKSYLVWETSPRDVPFSDTWFSTVPLKFETFQKLRRGDTEGLQSSQQLPLEQSYFFLFDLQEFCFWRASHSPFWQCLSIRGWCCWWASLTSGIRLGCWLRSKTPYRWLIYKSQNADVLI